ncbi:hypothetical protein DLR11_25235 [Salmonella enterica subsp. salamae]|nr:hypothetical protein [Salmonella enterica subsp. salamae]
MRKISLKNFLFMVLLIFIPLSKAMAGEIQCASPQETVLHFYRWYLNEINGEKYPLTQNYNGDKTRINKWVSLSLLSELKKNNYMVKLIMTILLMHRIFLNRGLRILMLK